MAGGLIVVVAAGLAGAASLAGRDAAGDSPLGLSDGISGGALVAPAAVQVGADGPLLSAADLAALRNASTAPALSGGKAAGSAGSAGDNTPASDLASSGIPSTALQAYQQAAAREAQLSPSCGLTWPLLGGIGRVESNHGRFAGAVLHSDGLSTPRVVGIALDGNGTALIADTDNGKMDGDRVYDRAVGPMQFIPSTWANWGVDANGDGVKDPYNIFDAAAASADYLCAAGRNLTTTRGQVQAILSYNYSYDYVRLVMGVEQVYAEDVGISVPVLPTPNEPTSGPPKQKPPLPPVDPGEPPGLQDPTPTPPKNPPSSGDVTPSWTPPPPSTVTAQPPSQPVPSQTKTVTSSPKPPSSTPPPPQTTTATAQPPSSDGPSTVTATPDPGAPSGSNGP